MYSMILADSLKRWQTLRGKRALLCTGTDEHGMKVQRAAALESDPDKRDPKKFADINAATFRELARASQIDNDFFIRTTDPDHMDAVKHFWFLLKEKGYIYESKHEGWYSVSDECFFPESMIVKRMDPMTGKVFPASAETGSAVEWTIEKNYHFRMTALKDKLLDFYKENPDWVVPATRMKEVVNWVTNNLEDLSISRPYERLSWGIRVPDDPSQTIYVWVDALINYLTKAGFPGWAPGREQAGGWPADVHVIGKDILRFHCVYWPALLLALELPLPKRILSHAHWTMGRQKMSKSIGNVVNPFFAMDRFGVDTMRFYLIHEGGIANDSDYENTYIVDRYKKLLQWGLGNMTGRITRSKAWSVREAVVNARDGGLLPIQESEGIYADQQALLEGLAPRVASTMDELNPSAALGQIMEVVAKVCCQPAACVIPFSHANLSFRQTNKFITDAEPWNQAKNGDESKALLSRTVFLSSESLRIAGILLQPFIPKKASDLLDMLGVSPDQRHFDDAKVFADFNYGEPMQDPGRGQFDALFPPLPVED
jgi:methionyl-tRNA synthetase